MAFEQKTRRTRDGRAAAGAAPVQAMAGMRLAGSAPYGQVVQRKAAVQLKEAPTSEDQLIRDLIAGGTKSENTLTNEVFFARHPDKRGTQLAAGSPDAKEWVRIRNDVVRPILSAPPEKEGGSGSGEDAGAPDALGIIAATVAKLVFKAIDGLGTDEALLFAALGQIKGNAALIARVRVVYQTTYGRDILDDLRGDLSGEDEARALAVFHVPVTQKKTETAPATKAVPKKADPKKAPSEKAKAPSGYYTHPNASKVSVTYGANAVALNSTAENLLKSILAKAGMTQGYVSSTLRTYADQARINYEQNSKAQILKWYGSEVHATWVRYKAEGKTTADYAKYLEDRDKARGRTISNHIPGYALDVAPHDSRFSDAAATLVPVAGSGVRTYLVEKGCTHTEFTFLVT